MTRTLTTSSGELNLTIIQMTGPSVLNLTFNWKYVLKCKHTWHSIQKKPSEMHVICT